MTSAAKAVVKIFIKFIKYLNIYKYYIIIIASSNFARVRTSVVDHRDCLVVLITFAKVAVKIL